MKKRTPKAAFFIVALLIVALCFTAFFGVYSQYGDRVDTHIHGLGDIRWGIDIQGGVDATFGPSDENVTPSDEDLEAIKAIIEERMIAKNITDYEAYIDTAEGEVIVRFPWANENESAEKAVQWLGQLGNLQFRLGDSSKVDEHNNPTGEVVLEGKDIESASAEFGQTSQTGANENYISLTLKDSGTKKFSDATKKQMGDYISIWLDYGENWQAQGQASRYEFISAPQVEAQITDGKATITQGGQSYEEAKRLADIINAGSLPFSISAGNIGTTSPSLGEGALNAMAIAAIIAMIGVCLLMIVIYRLPGFVAAIALCGQMALTVACLTGYFGFMDPFTMTLPGIAGLILSIGIGVDCNVITAEAVRDELRAGKTIDSAIRSGSKGSFWAIFDGNITVLIVAAVLMGVFGSSDGVFGWLFSWLPVSATGSVYAFGFTLLLGVITNFVMGLWASRVMLRSISRFKIFRNPWFYGGERK